jgi:ABC-type cobalamin/Fe3+-siderophores transport system ATPase subunit
MLVCLALSNWCGKSTLLKLMARMYDPMDGMILMGGIPLEAIDLGKSVRNKRAPCNRWFGTLWG